MSSVPASTGGALVTTADTVPEESPGPCEANVAELESSGTTHCGLGVSNGRASALAAGAMKACRGSAETVSSTTRRSWTRRRGRDSDEGAVFTPAKDRKGRTTAVPPLTPEMLVAARFIDFGDSWAPEPAAP